MRAARAAATMVMIAAMTGCASLSYDAPDDPAMPRTAGAETTSEAPQPAATPTPPAPPVLISAGSEPSEEALADIVEEAAASAAGANDLADDADEAERAWYTLTRLAREKRQVGRFDEAATLLEQATMQVAMRPAGSIQRRTVHGMRARHALDLLALGRDDEANALADELFEEVEADPEVGGPATIELASQIASHRASVAEENGLDASPLPLLRIALEAAEGASPNRDRLGLAFRVAAEAEFEGDLPLARTAIDRAIADSRVVESANVRQLASLELQRARVVLAEGDLDAAEQSAIRANRLLDEGDSDPDVLAIGESIMARIAAMRGDADRARAIALTAQSRLGGDPPVPDIVARRVHGELARMERALGANDRARASYRAALDLPGTRDRFDENLVEALTRELAVLDAPEDAPRVELDAADAGDGA